MKLSKCKNGAYVTPNISVEKARELKDEAIKYAQELSKNSESNNKTFSPAELPGSKLPGNVGVVYGLTSMPIPIDSYPEFLDPLKKPAVAVQWYDGENEIVDPNDLDLYEE